MEKIPENKREELIEELCLAYPTWFYEVLVEFEGGPLVLEPFQIKYLLDDSTFKITNKSRQMGGSVQLALAKFFKAYRNPSYRCDIVSINLKEAADKIKKIRDLWDSLPASYQIPLSIDNNLSIGFHEGNRKSVINSLAASSGIRGGRKDVVFDEFAHIKNNKELFQAALPAIMNGQLSVDIVSTPSGRHNLFGEMWLNEPNAEGKRKFDYFSRHEFYWYDTTRFINVPDTKIVRDYWENELGKNMNLMPELVDKFGNDKLQAIRSMFPMDYFLQEFCGHFIDDTTALFSFELINKCLRGPVGEIDGYTEEALEPWTERPEDNNNFVIMGVDFGQSGEGDDKTSIQILERDKDGKLKHRYSRNLNRRQYPTFPDQAQEIVNVAQRFKVNKINADSTGLGLGIVPLIKKLAPSLPVEGVNFNVPEKEHMVMNLKTLMEQNMVWLMEDDKALQAEIHNIKGDVLPSGTIRYHGEPHDDMFWALALAAREGVYKHFAVYTIDSLMKGLV